MAEIKRILVRRDTLANWTGVVPANGEPIGIITDDPRVTVYKIGDGATAADQLPALSKGDKGSPGTPGADGAQGLPGTNAVPADEAVAGYVSTTGTSSTKTALAGFTLTKGRSRIVDVEDLGAIRGRVLTDVSMTAGSAVVHSASYSFTTSDIGKTVGVRGAGVFSDGNDGVHVAVVSSVSGGDATLSAAATTTCTSAMAVVGFLADAAFAAARDKITALGGGHLFVPEGVWLVQNSLTVTDRTSLIGAGRGITQIFVTKVGAATGTDAPWYRRAGGPAYRYMDMADFTIDGSFYASAGGFGDDMKMLFMTYTDSSTVERIETINNPATAVPYDESTNLLIANNRIINGGRLAKIGSSNGSPAGSGIGLAVGGAGGDLSITIRDNFIKGLWTKDGGTGRSGINLEMSGVPTDVGNAGGGVKVVNNTIEGYFNGIVDSGGAGNIVSGNTVRRCQIGIKAGTNGVSTGIVGRDMIITGNTVEDCVAGGGYASVGIMVASSGSMASSEGRTHIADNIVRAGAGVGIRVNGSSGTVQHVSVKHNDVRDNDGFGIQVSGVLNDVAVVGNSVSSNARAQTAAVNKVGIKVDDATVWTDGRLADNDLTDYQTTPTQVTPYSLGAATLTNVRVVGNTGDPNPTAVYKRTGADTTITNTTTYTAVAGASVTLNPNTKYVLEALIVYTSTAAAGAKFRWTTPSGAVSWSIDGPGAPVSVISQTGEAALSGVDGAGSIAARVMGRIEVGATGGAFTLSAAQVTPTADSLVVKSGTFIEARPV
ncbi:right-handed parallel beta-helix repeat-containing protein [Curtobacterium flaccumfaciens pv. beticola]|uniref:right-handed parallel beta-helix repeat-containing protein n=1 Tax=Curtobacterium flaccumfaciens TaxID=2035 RepID=UPI00349F9E2B|nr:right-handed parallel beta-helix repeat-containing protein [Curtobacterium flaccumfaciens pv. basellae]